MNEKIMKAEASYDFLKDEIHCLYAEKKELQSRINKAIEYIENSDKYDFSKCELLDILKGSDTNE